MRDPIRGRGKASAGRAGLHEGGNVGSWAKACSGKKVLNFVRTRRERVLEMRNTRREKKINAAHHSWKLGADPLTNPSGHSMTIHGTLAHATTDNDRNPRQVRVTAMYHAQHQEWPAVHEPRSANARQRACAVEPVSTGEHSPATLDTDGETLAPFLPTPTKHATARGRLHARAKAVDARASAALGLIGPLHRDVSCADRTGTP